jgi:hypothetical protein
MRVSLSPVEILLPLSREDRGHYLTRDERWEVIENPGRPDEWGIGSGKMPRRAWFIFPARGKHPDDVDCEYPAFAGSRRAWATLREVKAALRMAAYLDVETKD